MALLFTISTLCACVSGEPPAPNVLLVSIDSLRADHVHAYGYDRPTSPNIDRLATDGARFATTISPSSWTLPTHVTLLTSLPPEVHGVVNARTRLSDEAWTLAEVFQSHGYATAGFVSGPNLRGFYGYRQGFDVYDDKSLGRLKDLRGDSSPTLVGLATDWLDGWNRAGRVQPFFLFAHLWDVHYDYSPPPPYDSMFDPGYDRSFDFSHFERNKGIRADMDPRDLRHLIALYDGEIRYTDDHLGRLLAKLDELGVADDTIVVVTADHGDEFFEHGQKGHSKTLFDEIVRVPFVLRYPRRVPPGRVIGPQVRLMDVGPTILGLAGVPPGPGFGVAGGPAGSRFQDLSPWIVGGSSAGPFPRLTAFGETKAWRPKRVSIRTEDTKVIQSFGGRNQRLRQAFDLAADPAERRNLAERARVAQPDLLALDRRLTQWVRHWANDEHELREPAQPSEKHIERLRALGYVE